MLRNGIHLPREKTTRIQRFSRLDDKILALGLPKGAIVHDSVASSGIAGLSLARKLIARGVRVVFSDKEFILNMWRKGSMFAFTDKQGRIVDLYSQGQRLMHNAQDTPASLGFVGEPVPLDITDPRVRAYMAEHPGALAQREVDVLRDEMAAQEFDLVMNMNLLWYLEQHEIVPLIKRLGRTVKDGGWLVVGAGDDERLTYALWQRQGNKLVLTSKIKQFVVTGRPLPFVNISLEEEEAFQDVPFAVGMRTSSRGLAEQDQAQKNVSPGGIDLDPAQMDMNVESRGESFDFNIDPAMLERLQNASGLHPIIIDIQPLTIPVPVFLGARDTVLPEQLAFR